MFDYNLKSPNAFSVMRPRKNFYKCHKVIKRVYNPAAGKSYALIELKKEVKDRTPVEMNMTGDLSVRDELVVLGHMRGLPLKIDHGAKVIEKYDDIFTTNTDIPGRLTLGAGIFNKKNFKLEGIMVHGTMGYTENSDGCLEEDRNSNEESFESVFMSKSVHGQNNAWPLKN